MNKKFLLSSILFLCLSGFIFSQSHEGYVFEIAGRINYYLPTENKAQLFGNDRYIQLGFAGYQKDVNDLTGYIDRYAINDRDMIIRVEPTQTIGSVSYYKFYLDPLYDANNFQKMLESFKITKYFIETTEFPIEGFSNTIYAFLKSKK